VHERMYEFHAVLVGAVSLSSFSSSSSTSSSASSASPGLFSPSASASASSDTKLVLGAPGTGGSTPRTGPARLGARPRTLVRRFEHRAAFWARDRCLIEVEKFRTAMGA
jgi:hypothetical protein